MNGFLRVFAALCMIVCAAILLSAAMLLTLLLT